MNEPLRWLLASGISMRRSALLLGIHRITVARKLHFLGIEARKQMFSYRTQWAQIGECQFDELETFEHSKHKPLSVVMAVLPKSRKILSFQVAQMPAKGLLAKASRQKYGKRRDFRSRAILHFLNDLKPHIAETATFFSDSNPLYPEMIKRVFPKATHQAVLGGRGCSTGQGELKRLSFDPLFSLNHTFAMLRANISRLIRKTWNTTKKPQALADHIALYAHFHNSVLTS